MEPIKNKVAESGIITLDLAPFIPREVMFFDLKPFLFKELILKEKDYRDMLKSHDWSTFAGKHVAVGCSTDAIIPVWAFMLATTYLSAATSVNFGTVQETAAQIISENIAALEEDDFRDKRLILKGCGDIPIPETAYVAATRKLLPVVKSLMYGEPCSTVPVYKQPKVAIAATA